MSRLHTLFLVVLALCLADTTSAQEPGKDKEKINPSIWMKQKLDRSKDILEGLVSSDFDKIATAAQALSVMNTIEGFARRRTPGYRAQLQIFEDANAEILRQANRDNLEGVTLAFQQLTSSCVNCHKQLRAENAK